MKPMTLSLFSLFVLLAAAPAPAKAKDAHSAPPLFDGLGRHARAVAAEPEAKRFFDQGLMFMFAFNHDEAVRAFRHAAALDPDCAMAYWGIALASGKNYNDPTFPPDRAKAAWAALDSARAKA